MRPFFRSHIWLLILFGLFFISALGIGAAFHLTERQYEHDTTERIATRVAEDIENEIWRYIQTLTLISYSQPIDKEFNQMASAAIEVYPALFAINLVDQTGRIIRVFPEAENQLALGRNLLTHEEVSKYLLESKESRSPNMSHYIVTYQLIEAFTLYLPLFEHNNGDFEGWLNAVVDFKSWIKEYSEREEIEGAHIKVEWDHPFSQSIDIGEAISGTGHSFKFPVLNQALDVSVTLNENFRDKKRERLYKAVMGVVILLLFGSLCLVLGLLRSRQSMMEAHGRLKLKDTLLSALTHDTANPLTSLNFILSDLLERSQFSEKEKLRAYKALGSLNQITKSARSIHAHGLGIKVIDSKPTNLFQAIDDALSLIQETALRKELYIKINLTKECEWIEAEPVTLNHHVLQNVLNNAIKFSPEGGSITVTSVCEGTRVSLSIEDQGPGFSDKQILNFKRRSPIGSSLGSQGERGTGLGLLQVRSFMDAYGGSTSLSKSSTLNGAKVTLIFNGSEKRPEASD